MPGGPIGPAGPLSPLGPAGQVQLPSPLPPGLDELEYLFSKTSIWKEITWRHKIFVTVGWHMYTFFNGIMELAGFKLQMEISSLRISTKL